MGLNRVLEGFTQISNESSRLKKIKVFKRLIKTDKSLLEEILKYTFYSFWNYNISLDENEYRRGLVRFEIPLVDPRWKELKHFLDRCRTSKVSGNNAKRDLHEIMSRQATSYAYWLMRIVNRDLKMGLSDRTIRKYLPGLLPEVKPMLCQTLDLKTMDNPEKYAGWIAEPKYDGLRATVVIENGKAVILSRSGKPLFNCESILRDIEKLNWADGVYDGEVFTEDWNKTVSIVHTQTKHLYKGKIEFFIWDLIRLDDWKNRKCTERQPKRKQNLKFALQSAKTKTLVYVPYEIVGKEKNALKTLMDKYLQKGFEGIVIKDPDGKYEWTKSKRWLKVKPVYEGDFKIDSIVVAVKGRHKGKIRALYIKGYPKWKNKTWKIYSRVGGGFTDKQRKEFLKKKYIGSTVQVEFQEVSLKKGKRGNALRFPVFIRIRKDKDN